MLLEKSNNSYYRYEASFHMWYKDKTEEIKNISYDTDILYNHLHLWNRKSLTRKYKRLVVEKMAHDKRLLMCELLQEDLVLISRFYYTFIE